MSRKRQWYPDEFRREAVRLLETSGKSVSEVAQELGVYEKALYRWRKQFGQKAQPANPEQAALQAEVERLQQENEVLRQERDILKKAISICSQIPDGSTP